MKQFIILFILLASVSTILAEDCIIDGSEVELVGIISRETFPGPPNYESGEKGDKPETYWILTLKEKYNCAKMYSYESGELYRIDGSFNRFQLRLNQNLYEKKEALLNTDVRVKGKVETGITGHQHTKMLIDVISMEAEDNSNTHYPKDANSKRDVDQSRISSVPVIESYMRGRGVFEAL